MKRNRDQQPKRGPSRGVKAYARNIRSALQNAAYRVIDHQNDDCTQHGHHQTVDASDKRGRGGKVSQARIERGALAVSRVLARGTNASSVAVESTWPANPADSCDQGRSGVYCQWGRSP